MTSSTMTKTTLAKRLFDFIRANKLALQEQKPPLTFSDSKGYAEREAVRALIQSMFDFERRFRGAQKWLAGIDAPEGFDAGKPTGQALAIFNQVLRCQAELTGAFWSEMMSMEGLHNGEFVLAARRHIRVDRLPQAVAAFTGFVAQFGDDQTLCLTLTNGAAVRKIEKAFPSPHVEGKTLQEQIAILNRYWTDIKHFVRETAKDPKCWPALSESMDIERARVERLVNSFFKGLSLEDARLLRKHEDISRRLFNNSL